MVPESKQLILGIDGGATKTTWALCQTFDGVLRELESGQTGPGSMKLVETASLRALLAGLPKNVGRVGVFLAGCVSESDRKELQQMASSIWSEAIIHAGSDRESSFAAAFGSGDGIVVMAGTGSAITGRHAGREDRAGGWGHLLGDSGGGYDLAIRALRRVLFDFDTAHRITPLASDLLQTLGLNTLRDLTAWAQTARKSDLARLTPLIFQHASDPEVAAMLENRADALAALVAAVARRLDYDRPPVRLSGSVLQKQPVYARLFTAALAQKWSGCEVAICHVPAALGAALLAAKGARLGAAAETIFEEPDLSQASTEQSNPRSLELHLRTTRELVELFALEERNVQDALIQATETLTRAVELSTAALRNGGRLFYAGAGTSGRLGVLDASEMPPTFGVSSDLVQAIIAGGPAALQHSIEGAEDDAAAGHQAVKDRGITSQDVLCGITASGRTPFVRGALESAAALGAQTILLTCNPARARHLTANVEIDLPTGPEIITGSTRLKAGSATKAALNIISSCTMIRLGRVDGNFMSHLRPTNNKLRERAVRIVAARLNVTSPEAKKLLQSANWNIREVLDFALPAG